MKCARITEICRLEEAADGREEGGGGGKALLSGGVENRRGAHAIKGANLCRGIC